mmetsp:Transcript_34412/g.31111  ORF Transcript_34412/g.31111 Transcript_34412/m.31111 type:complete len:110 (+) Transcript_34412:1199-1528(+)
MSTQTPFKSKKGYLRCLFQVYMRQYGGLNHDFEMKNFIDVFTDIILPDIKLFEKYITGLVDVRTSNPKKKKDLEQLRERVDNYCKRLFNQDTRRDERNYISNLAANIQK